VTIEECCQLGTPQPIASHEIFVPLVDTPKDCGAVFTLMSLWKIAKHVITCEIKSVASLRGPDFDGIIARHLVLNRHFGANSRLSVLDRLSSLAHALRFKIT